MNRILLDNFPRKFKLKNTSKYEQKRLRIRNTPKLTKITIQDQLSRTSSLCDIFLQYCLKTAQQIRSRLDPEGTDNKQSIYQCKFCSKIFTKSTALGGHTSKVHKQQSKSIDIISKDTSHHISKLQHYQHISKQFNQSILINNGKVNQLDPVINGNFNILTRQQENLLPSVNENQ